MPEVIARIGVTPYRRGKARTWGYAAPCILASLHQKLAYQRLASRGPASGLRSYNQSRVADQSPVRLWDHLPIVLLAEQLQHVRVDHFRDVLHVPVGEAEEHHLRVPAAELPAG